MTSTLRVGLVLLFGVFLLTAVGMTVMGGDDPLTAADGASFTDVAVERGLDYSSVVRGNTAGSGRQGVYVIDYNDDGWEDLIVTGGKPSIAVFTNTEGEFERANVLPRASTEMPVSIKSVHVLDYDNDGLEDLLVLPRDGTGRLLENVGGEFRIRSQQFAPSLTMPLGATSLDYNRDGCLDVFVIQSGDWAREIPRAFSQPDANVTADNGNPNMLFRGTCSGFDRVDLTAPGNHWSLATSAVDLTDDGWPDIHVANDYFNDVVYVNQGDGTFERRVLGPRTDRNGMSSEVADVNRDHQADLFVTNIFLEAENASTDPFRRYIEHRLGKRARGNVLLLNTGNGRVRDAAETYGVRNGGWGWAASITDFDNDRRLEYLHATQIVGGMQRQLYRRLATPTYWDRTPNGTTRRNATAMGFTVTDGRGVATFDYDRDGDRDVAIANRDGAFRLYENRETTGNWLQIRLEDDGAPTTGSEVYVTVNGTTRFYAANAKSDFLSQDSRTLHVGLGDVSSVEKIRILRPDGSEQTFSDIDANQYVTVTRTGMKTSGECFFRSALVNIC